MRVGRRPYLLIRFFIVLKFRELSELVLSREEFSEVDRRQVTN